MGFFLTIWNLFSQHWDPFWRAGLSHITLNLVLPKELGSQPSCRLCPHFHLHRAPPSQPHSQWDQHSSVVPGCQRLRCSTSSCCCWARCLLRLSEFPRKRSELGSAHGPKQNRHSQWIKGSFIKESHSCFAKTFPWDCLNKFPGIDSACRAALGVRGARGCLGCAAWIHSGKKGHFSNPSKTCCSNFSFLVTLQGLNLFW